MTGQEVRKMSDEDIKQEIGAIRRKEYDLRVQMTTEKVEDTSQFGKLRKDLARLLTERTARARKKLPARAPAAKPTAKAGAKAPAARKAPAKRAKAAG